MRTPEQTEKLLNILQSLDCLDFDEIHTALAWMVLQVLLEHHRRSKPAQLNPIKK